MKTQLLFCVAILFSAPALSAEPWYYQDSNQFEFQVPDKVTHYWGSRLLSERTSPELALAAGLLWELHQRLQGGEFGEKDLALDILGSYRIGFVDWNARAERWTLILTVRF